MNNKRTSIKRILKNYHIHTHVSAVFFFFFFSTFEFWSNVESRVEPPFPFKAHRINVSTFSCAFSYKRMKKRNAISSEAHEIFMYIYFNRSRRKQKRGAENERRFGETKLLHRCCCSENISAPRKRMSRKVFTNLFRNQDLCKQSYWHNCEKVVQQRMSSIEQLTECETRLFNVIKMSYIES